MTKTSANSSANGRRQANRKHQFYIASCNLLNFANPNRVYYPNAYPYDEAGYQKKLNGLTQLLKQTKADIIGVQELWDLQALQALAVNLGFEPQAAWSPLASNNPKNTYTKGQGAQDTPAMGMISRFPRLTSQLFTDIMPAAIMDIPDMGAYTKFKRPPIMSTYDVMGQEVMVVNAHLKSKRPLYLRDDNGELLEDSNDPHIRVRAKMRSLCMRAVEAASIRMQIINFLRHTHVPLILLGDMNDVTKSVTTQLLAETGEVNYDKSMRDVALFDAASVQRKYGWMREVAYTHIHQGVPEIIDQLFVSEEFLLDSKFSLGHVECVDYFNDHLKWDYADKPSDHGIVRAKIHLKD